MNAVIKTNGVSLNLDMKTVRNYICPNATEKEIYMFLQVCKVQQLNPFLREVYLVKYSDREPANTLIGIETFRKRAYRNPKYKGHTTTTEGEGSNMTATTEVYLDGYTVPISCTVEYDEYVGRRKDGQVTRFWASKPKTMLKKVSEAQALRTAFPEEFGGLYSMEEINSIPPQNLPTEPVKAVLPKSEPLDYKSIRDWADCETDISKLSERFNATIEDHPEVADYIRSNIMALQNGGN